MSPNVRNTIRRLIHTLEVALSLALRHIILIYRYTLSYWLGRQCRFIPSCSEYALDALKLYPFHRALIMIIKRVGSCHPFSGPKDRMQYDPVQPPSPHQHR